MQQGLRLINSGINSGIITIALQGVGPATASAILEAFDPTIAFTSDEAMLAALDSKDYTGGLDSTSEYVDSFGILDEENF
jgi:hypothetical protein